MDGERSLAAGFEQNRARLRAVAYRMLGSLPEAEDAVQEAWLRLSRSDADAVQNLAGWLTTVVARVCLDLLRARKARREDPLDPGVVEPASEGDVAASEEEAELADAVGLALLVILQKLTPGERLAFVLHDMFELPFEEIAPIVGPSPAAARQLASRARRRVRGTPPPEPVGPASERQIVDAFLAASRSRDFTALLAVLDPEVVLHADGEGVPGRGARIVHGAERVARQALSSSERSHLARPARINGRPGLIVAPLGRLLVTLGFVVKNGRIAQIEVVTDPKALRTLDLALLED
jgi:RNA polymerase sigma factor (sigma-70 family)